MHRIPQILSLMCINRKWAINGRNQARTRKEVKEEKEGSAQEKTKQKTAFHATKPARMGGRMAWQPRLPRPPDQTL